MTIDIHINEVHPDTDTQMIVGYLGALLQQMTGVQAQVNIIDTDYVDPIKLLNSLKINPQNLGR